MARIYHDEDADPSALAGGTLAVVGDGNQDRAGPLFERIRAARDRHPIAGWEETARRAFRIGAPRED